MTVNLHTRRILAAAFLLLLLSEWGAHSIVETCHSSGEQPAIFASHTHHADTCESHVLGGDTGRDRSRPTSSDEQDLFSSSTPESRRGFAPRDLNSRFSLAPSDGIFRPGSPPFVPPEIS